MSSDSDFIELNNDEGLDITLCSYGATLVSAKFPDKQGNIVDCVLGFDKIEDYYKDIACMGRTTGRVSNRIKNSSFTFKGKEYKLPSNCPPHFLHGGPHGISLRKWEVVRQSCTSCTFRIKCDESIDGLPGNAVIEVTYTINDKNQLVLEHFSTCSENGVLNLSNHAYWNLDESENIKNHTIFLEAQEYLPIDETCCPTGGQLLVKGTNLDFTKGKKLSELCDDEHIVDIDHDFVLDYNRSTGGNAIVLQSSKSGIQLKISTSYPIIHLYGGKYLNTIGKKGSIYGPNKGIAIEPQFYSAAVNYSHFPPIDHTSDKAYGEEIIYSFSHSD